MAIEEHARGLAAWVDHWATQVLEVGSTCALGGDATWDAILQEHGVAPLPPAERQRHIKEGPRRSRGALPIEVRWAIEAVYKRSREAARALDLRVETPEEQRIVDGIERRLVNLVEETTHAHLQRARDHPELLGHGRSGGPVADEMQELRRAAEEHGRNRRLRLLRRRDRLRRDR